MFNISTQGEEECSSDHDVEEEMSINTSRLMAQEELTKSSSGAKFLFNVLLSCL